MSSFLEKLRRGTVAQNQNTDNETEASPEETILGEGLPPEGVATFAAYKTKPAVKKKGIPSLEENGPSKRIITAENIDELTAPPEEPAPKKKLAAEKNKKAMPNKKISAQEAADREWLDNEGRLAVNVYQTENDLVAQAAIAGIKADDVEVVIEDDVIIIKGERPNPLAEDGDYFIEECYWGPFSRKIILPVEVDSSRADAAMKDGVLTVRIPKIQREKKKKLTIKE